MHILSFYIYFVKSACLCFINSFFPLCQFQEAFFLLVRQDFKKLHIMKEMISGNAVFTSLINAPTGKKRSALLKFTLWSITIHCFRKWSSCLPNAQSKLWKMKVRKRPFHLLKQKRPFWNTLFGSRSSVQN